MNDHEEAFFNPYQLQLPPIKTFSVSVYGNGFYGQFKLPETHFKELTSYLSERVLP